MIVSDLYKKKEKIKKHECQCECEVCKYCAINLKKKDLIKELYGVVNNPQESAIMAASSEYMDIYPVYSYKHDLIEIKYSLSSGKNITIWTERINKNINEQKNTYRYDNICFNYENLNKYDFSEIKYNKLNKCGNSYKDNINISTILSLDDICKINISRYESTKWLYNVISDCEEIDVAILCKDSDIYIHLGSQNLNKVKKCHAHLTIKNVHNNLFLENLKNELTLFNNKISIILKNLNPEQLIIITYRIISIILLISRYNNINESIKIKKICLEILIYIINNIDLKYKSKIDDQDIWKTGLLLLIIDKTSEAFLESKHDLEYIHDTFIKILKNNFEEKINKICKKRVERIMNNLLFCPSVIIHWLEIFINKIDICVEKGYCICSSMEFGKYLEKAKNESYDLKLMINIGCIAQYNNNAFASVSYTQSQQIFLGNNINIIGDLFKKGALWIDIGQKEPFDNNLCAKEYENTVIIIDKELNGCDNIINSFTLLLNSEWSGRGWTYQEIALSKKIIIWTGNWKSSIEILKSEFNKKLSRGLLKLYDIVVGKKNILIPENLSRLLDRIWRKQEDIYKCVSMFTKKSYENQFNLLKNVIGANIILAAGKSINRQKGTYWICDKLDRKGTWPKGLEIKVESLTSEGIEIKSQIMSQQDFKEICELGERINFNNINNEIFPKNQYELEYLFWNGEKEMTIIEVIKIGITADNKPLYHKIQGMYIKNVTYNSNIEFINFRIC